MRIRMGTIRSNAAAGRTSRRAAPVTPPSAAATSNGLARVRCPASSRRYPTAPLIVPGTNPTVFETFAMSGGYPRSSKVGKVTSDPAPTIAFTVPAKMPTAMMTTAPSGSSKRASF